MLIHLTPVFWLIASMSTLILLVVMTAFIAALFALLRHNTHSAPPPVVNIAASLGKPVMPEPEPDTIVMVDTPTTIAAPLIAPMFEELLTLHQWIQANIDQVGPTDIDQVGPTDAFKAKLTEALQVATDNAAHPLRPKATSKS